jgi:hypothetical protein
MTEPKEVHLVFQDGYVEPVGAYLSKDTAQKVIDMLYTIDRLHSSYGGPDGDPVYTLITVKVEND